MISPNRTSLLVVVVGLAACAGGSAPLPIPAPEEVPGLEADVRTDPGDVASALRLAAVYRELERTGDARAVVERGLAETPEDPGLTAMAGLLAEDEGSFSEARERYESYLANAPKGPLRDEIERRLDSVRRSELQQDVRNAIAREAELAQSAPDPGALGIFPFVFEGGDAQWEPLGPALAELLITDMSLTGRLDVLERVRVQTLLTELALGEAGLAEPATAARSGRILGSGLVIQGRYRIDENQRIDVDAAVVEVGPPGTRTVDPVRAGDRIERLFELEKQLAIDLHAEIGIQLTPAERARLEERQTESVQALLAFGRGLEASDAGDFTQAERYFAQASELDPSFALAQSRRQSASRAAGARGPAASRRIAAQATRMARQRAAVRALRNAPASVRQRMLQRLTAHQRAVLAEVLGQDRVGSAILLELVFTRPGGDR
jgi:tetratricopeptide (TPR) repeat protein